MDKLRVINITNPFNLDSKEVLDVEYSPLKVVSDYSPDTSTDLIVSLNGQVLTKEEQHSLIPKRNDCIVYRPVVEGGGGGGSNILGTIAAIALTVFAFAAAPVIGGWIGGGTGLTAAGAFTTASMIAFGAIMSIGGLLLGSLFQEDIPSYDVDGSKSATYGWNGVKSLTGQGNPVAVTFGTVKTAGQILATHVTAQDDKQYLNILLSGGEGELDFINDLRIDGNPISNYDGVEYEIRLGTNDQAIIPNFSDTFADKNLSFLLEVGNSATQQTDGDGGEGLEIVVDFPNGLYHVTNDGNPESTSVTLTAEYRIRTSAPGVFPEVYGAWQPWVSTTITEAKNSAVKKTYRIDNIPIGKYEVRVTKTSETGSTNRYVNRCYWTMLSHIIYDDFSYPRTALVGIKALATDQLSGSMPEITWKQGRANVYVWNPSTLVYETKPANNPAWACYDIVHYCRYIKNINTNQYEYMVFGFPHNRIDYSAFKEWADFCDLAIDAPTDISPSLQFDSLCDSIEDLWTALRPIENNGRGKVILKGTRVSCIYDGVKTPVQQFTMGNIIKDSFVEEFLPLRDRANAVEITYFDSEKDYERSTVSIYDESFDTVSTIPNTSQITLYGCTRLKQALREGRYRLNLNKYLVRTITFDADIDSIACQIGDIINFQHDVPQWGYGGRIEFATTSNIKIDQEVELLNGVSYQIQVTLSDGIVESRNVVTQSEDIITNIIPITSAFSSLPLEYSPYAFGRSFIVTKPFRIIGLTRSADFRRRITAIEYIEDVYDNSESIPEVQYSDLTFELTNLLLTKYVDSYGLTYIHMSWNTPKYSYGGVIITVDGIKVAKLGSNESSYNYLASNNGTYTVKLQVLDYFGVIRSVVTQLVNLDNIPLTPSGLTVTISDQVYCKWNSNPSTDVDFYELRLDTNYGEVTNMLFKGMALSTTIKLSSRTGTIYLYAHSSSGYYSSPLVHIYNFPAPPAPTITLAPLFQGFTVTTTTFPSTVNGISVHINDGSGGDEIYLSPNNRYDYKRNGGVFDVSVAFTDVFGEGTLSSISEITVTPTIDPALIAAESLSLEKMDGIIQDAVAQAQNAVSGTTFNTTVNQLTQADATNASNITQTANSVTSVITELNKNLADCSYSAITQAKSAIELRVASADYNGNTIISKINLGSGTVTIDGKYVHITGDTVFDNSVIVGNMLAANSVTTNKIATGAITADKIAAGAITADKIATNAITAGKIAAGAITADKITAGSIDATKLSQNSVSLDKMLKEAWTPCWASYVAPIQENNKTAPWHFDKTYKSSVPSLGYIRDYFGSNNFDAGGLLFEMNIYCTQYVVISQQLVMCDDNCYYYVDGGLLASWGSGWHNAGIYYGLGAGPHSIQIVVNNAGCGPMGIILSGDFLNGTTIKYNG